MARIIDDDGLSAVEQIDQDTPTEEYPDWTRTPVGGFEDMIRGADEQLLDRLTRAPVAWDRRNGLSKSAYAYRITRGFARQRRYLNAHPHVEPILIDALRTGYEWAEAKRRFEWGALARAEVRRRHVARLGGRLGGKASGATRRSRNYPRVEARARELRKQHPNRRKYSTRRVAATVAHEFKLKVSAVRSILADLGIT